MIKRLVFVVLVFVVGATIFSSNGQRLVQQRPTRNSNIEASGFEEEITTTSEPPTTTFELGTTESPRNDMTGSPYEGSGSEPFEGSGFEITTTKKPEEFTPRPTENSTAESTKAPTVKPTVKPTQGPVEPTQGPVEPTQGPVEPTQGPVEPTQGPVEPTQGPVEPTQGPVEPTQGPVEPTQGPVEPTQGPVEPTQGPVQPPSLLNDKRCMIWGNHMRQFDGSRFSFNRMGRFLAARYSIKGYMGNSSFEDFFTGGPSFAVEISRGWKHPRSYVTTYKTTVKYLYRGERREATILPGARETYVNKVRVLPGSKFQGVRVLQQGLFTVLIFESEGLIVRAGFLQGVIISVDESLVDDVTGLCGGPRIFNNNNGNNNNNSNNGNNNNNSNGNNNNNNNGNNNNNNNGNNNNNNGNNNNNSNGSSNNMVDQTESIFERFQLALREEELKEIKIPMKMPQRGDRKCENDRFLQYVQGPRACGLFDNHSLLHSCHLRLPSDYHYEECVKSLTCDESSFLPALESSLTSYLTECIAEDEDPPIIPIRNVIGMGYVCPENAHYVSALSSCPRTCADRNGTICEGRRALQDFNSVEGCECDEGFIWSGGKCVAEGYCGCVSPIDGLYFEHGQCYTGEGCSQRCQCRSGEWECEPFRCYKSQRCIVVDGLSSCQVADKCKLDNGGCDDICSWNNVTDDVTCSCQPGSVLTPDHKTCVEVANEQVQTNICIRELNRWRDSYRMWKAEFMRWKNMSVANQSRPSMCAPTWRFEGDVLGDDSQDMGRPSCDVYWTRWFNSDSPDGCGDDETIERLLDYYPEEMCADHIITMERRLVGSCDTPAGFEPVLRSDDRIEGLFCDNADQPLGAKCPDYTVRFLCNR